MIQSSGVGNIINMLSLPESCGIPFLMVVTMRGEEGEFNPWQVPMGQAVPSVLGAMNVKCHRPELAADIGAVFADAARSVFETRSAAAVLVSQHIIGAKEFD
jgi:sulfopyruvate decarboxylase TPP-binding subunit